MDGHLTRLYLQIQHRKGLTKRERAQWMASLNRLRRDIDGLRRLKAA